MFVVRCQRRADVRRGSATVEAMKGNQHLNVVCLQQSQIVVKGCRASLTQQNSVAGPVKSKNLPLDLLVTSSDGQMTTDNPVRFFDFGHTYSASEAVKITEHRQTLCIDLTEPVGLLRSSITCSVCCCRDSGVLIRSIALIVTLDAR